MGKLTEKEDAWQAKATAAAVAGARKIVTLNNASIPAMTPISKLSEQQWGWVITAAIFGWIQTRCEQAVAEGLDQEEAVRLTGLDPSPCDVAAVTSILPMLADNAAIDWTLPLKAWSKDAMSNFLLMAMRLINAAEAARDGGKILRKSEPEFDDLIPFNL